MQDQLTSLLNPLTHDAVEAEIPIGEIVINPNTDIDCLLYVISGEVKQYIITPSGDQIMIHIFEAPVILPAMVALSGKSNNFYFEANSTLRVKKIPTERFIIEMKQNPELSFHMATRFAYAINGLCERVVHLTGQKQKEQLLELLQYLGKKQGQVLDKGVYLDKKVTHAELASWMGSARETVSRLVKQLEKEGSIEIKNQRFFIKY